jgi:hypothetical protein
MPENTDTPDPLAPPSSRSPSTLCCASLILRDPSDLPEYDGEILVALWGANEWEIVNVRENVGGPFTAEYVRTGDIADPEEWQWWADLRELDPPQKSRCEFCGEVPLTDKERKYMEDHGDEIPLHNAGHLAPPPEMPENHE